MKHVIFAHSHCTDGLCAASIMKRAINICLNTEDIVVIFARYGAEKKALEQAEIDDKTNVYIVDFSFSREDTLDIAKKCKNLVILDHHITAFEKLDGIEKESDNIEFFFDNNMSGATLVNGFVAKRFLDFGKSQEVVNYVAELVEDRDLWYFKLKDTKAFGEFVFSQIEPNDIDTFSEILFDSDMKKIKSYVDLGNILDKNKKKQVNQRLEQMQTPTVLEIPYPETSEQVQIIFVNETQSDLISELGNAICKKFQKPVCLYKILSTGMVSLSFRSMDNLIDMSKVAVALGGGGHRNSSGCEVSSKILSNILNGVSHN